MKEKVHRNKKVILLCSGIVFVIILAFSISILNKAEKYGDAALNPSDIAKIHIKMEETGEVFSSDEFIIRESENIERVINYVKQMVITELKTSVNGVQPGKFEFIYHMKNGRIKTYKHDFLSVTSKDGFEAVFQLEEVIPQVNPIFTTSMERVSKATLFAWVDLEEQEPVMHDISNYETIGYVIEVGKRNLLLEAKEKRGDIRVGIQIENSDGVALFVVYIYPEMHDYDELCRRIPEVVEYVEMVSGME